MSPGCRDGWPQKCHIASFPIAGNKTENGRKGEKRDRDGSTDFSVLVCMYYPQSLCVKLFSMVSLCRGDRTHGKRCGTPAFTSFPFILDVKISPTSELPFVPSVMK